MDNLKKTKEEFIPEDGWILKETEVAFQGGETVFDVLKKVCGEMEYICHPSILRCTKLLYRRNQSAV